jgi:outer membrane protein OmpA-like peptidoglycan-associated protein
LAVLTLFSVAACATAVPPKELVEARADLTRAEDSAAKAYKPDELHEAQVALDRAERAFSDNGSDDRTLTLAYLAGRAAQLAETDGATAEAFERKNQAVAMITQVAVADLRRTRYELKTAREKLEAETLARKEMERRAKDALDKLMLASVPVKEEARGTVITLPGSVLFPSGKASLLTSGEQKLAQVAAALKDAPDQQIAVEGHTDSRGSDAINLPLSEQRARTVKSFLVAQGVAGDHIEALGLGSSVPVADNATAEGRADNRRVEIVIKPPPEPK